MAKPRWREPLSGTCRVCGCTDFNACDEGCWWVDKSETLCSSCAGTSDDLAYTLRAIVRLGVTKRMTVAAARQVVSAAAIEARRALKRHADRYRAHHERLEHVAGLTRRPRRSA